MRGVHKENDPGASRGSMYSMSGALRIVSSAKLSMQHMALSVSR